MNRIISEFPAMRDGDLMLCPARGVAYQADMGTERARYDARYFAKVSAYEGNAIAAAVNAGRCALLARHLEAGASVLDVGAGTGEFVRAARLAGFNACGFDVMPDAVDRLLAEGIYSGNTPSLFEAVTLWDTIEHLEDPAEGLVTMRHGAALFVSIPVFDDLRAIRSSKHYRPGEHLYYWTVEGFLAWAARYGFRYLEESRHEVEAGREAVGAFALRREETAALLRARAMEVVG